MRRPVVGLLAVVAFASGCAATNAEPRGPKFPISKETTSVTGPLDNQGYVDYAAALNARYGRGVTPENNANVVLWRTTGARFGFPKPTDDYFRALGIEPPPAEGDYFTGFTQFVSETETNHDLQNAANDEYASPLKPWHSGRYPHLAQWLTASDSHLAEIAAGLRRPEFYSPVVPPTEGSGTRNLMVALQPGMQEQFEIGRALLRRSLLNLGEGRTAEAWADILSAHRLGRLTARQATVLGALVGQSIELQAAEAAAAFVAEVTQPRAAWLAFLRQLDELPSFPPIAEKFDRHERFLHLDLLQALDRGDPSVVGALIGGGKADNETTRHYAAIDYEPALREGVAWFERLVSAASAVDRKERTRFIEQLVDETRRRDPSPRLNPPQAFIGSPLIADLKTGEAIGRRLLVALSLNAASAVDSADLRAQAAANLRVAVALAAYHAEHGGYPETLADLPAEPAVSIVDLFSGKPLIYRRLDDGFLLYSIGPNGRDDGGRRERDEPKGDDLPLLVKRHRPEK